MTCSLPARLRHFNNRISEVSNALVMIGLGVQIPPASDFRALDLLSGIVPDGSIAVLFIVVGMVRMTALIANGRWPEYGPWLRAIGALVTGVSRQQGQNRAARANPAMAHDGSAARHDGDGP